MKSKIKEINLEKGYESLIAYQSRFDLDFFVFAISSAVVCFFGFVMNNTAIIVGSMVLSPLLYPIIAIPTACLRKDWKNFANSLALLLVGFIIVFFLSWILGVFFPVDLVDLEVANGIKSNYLVFFFIAFFSGLAGNFCYFWPRASSAMTGVAISIALLPPIIIFSLSFSLKNELFFISSLRVIFANTVGILLGSFFVSVFFFVLKKRGVIEN
jgi:uncharacterized hydrophobic protein (TIGR00271 family)